MKEYLILENKFEHNKITRSVLFEKTDVFLSYIPLTDFRGWVYPLPNEKSIIDCITNLNETIIMGEFGQVVNSAEITFDNVSHTIEKLIFKNNVIYGIVKILDNHKGKILQRAYENNKIYFHMRALGNVEGEETVLQQIITWDAYINVEIK